MCPHAFSYYWLSAPPYHIAGRVSAPPPIWAPAHPYHNGGPVSPHFERRRALIISLDPFPPTLGAGAPLSQQRIRLAAALDARATPLHRRTRCTPPNLLIYPTPPHHTGS
ncbi:hypothetical protein Y032_0003g1583 [Ancylostoma ceylanicum]|uniref:Uncharacterized protein n=1 Tax=Ancylostoma ceylanicum TaxID=53326 RepID=A0A016VYQ1_9BILA|nr:hypothetical protein Y032_0003g1583 [Ancylostoma ceylanicum]